MAAVGTLQYLQDELQKLFDADTDTPTSTDEEWDVRTSLFNRAIREWEQSNSVRWRELWTTASVSSPGSAVLSTTSGTATYATPSDMAFPAGYVRVTASGQTTRYPVVGLSENQLYDSGDVNQYASFKGTPHAGYTLTIYPTPSTTGSTIQYDYYKRASELAAASDKIEMSDPDFALYYALSELFYNQRDLARYQNALSTAQEKLKNMELRNEDVGEWMDNSIPGLSNRMGIGFGD